MTSQGQRFRRRSLRRGYKVEEVDTFLDRVEATLNGERVDPPVRANEVHDIVFRVKFGGYDEWQVDLHLDRVERQLAEQEPDGQQMPSDRMPDRGFDRAPVPERGPGGMAGRDDRMMPPDRPGFDRPGFDRPGFDRPPAPGGPMTGANRAAAQRRAVLWVRPDHLVRGCRSPACRRPDCRRCPIGLRRARTGRPPTSRGTTTEATVASSPRAATARHPVRTRRRAIATPDTVALRPPSAGARISLGRTGRDRISVRPAPDRTRVDRRPADTVPMNEASTPTARPRCACLRRPASNHVTAVPDPATAAPTGRPAVSLAPAVHPTVRRCPAASAVPARAASPAPVRRPGVRVGRISRPARRCRPKRSTSTNCGGPSSRVDSAAATTGPRWTTSSRAFSRLSPAAGGPSADAELDPHRFNLVPGGYYEDEVDEALRQVRDMLRRR